MKAIKLMKNDIKQDPKTKALFFYTLGIVTGAFIVLGAIVITLLLIK